MIDIENIIVDMVTESVDSEFLTEHPGLCVYSKDVTVPESFPCVTVVMTDNRTERRTLTFSDPLEFHANVTLTINVYTNNENGKKELAKRIFGNIDDLLQRKHFTRIMAGPLPNIDRSVSRYTGRYTAVVGRPKTKEVDGETVVTFPVYRG